MRCLAALPILLLVGALSAVAENGVTVTDYRRPPASPLLPLDHVLLSRDPGVSPHVPEQVHLTLAGPGAMAVSWLTYPQVNTKQGFNPSGRFIASPSDLLDALCGL